MNIPLFKAAASNFSDIVNSNECVAVDFVNDFFHLAVFKAVDDARNFFVLFVCVGPFDQAVGGISAEAVIDGLHKLLRFFRNDFVGFGTAEPFFDQVDHFGCDEIRNSGKESALQTKNERHDDKDKHIEKENHIARSKWQFA